jgi:hypothetical protein
MSWFSKALKKATGIPEINLLKIDWQKVGDDVLLELEKKAKEEILRRAQDALR